MKRLLIALLVIPLISFGQKKQTTKELQDSVVFKNANKIIIENDKEINQNLYLVQMALLAKGYRVKIDRKAYVVSTIDSVINAGGNVYHFIAQIDEKHIVLTGRYATKGIVSPLGEINHVFRYNVEYSGARKAVSKKLFELLSNIANDIPGKKIYAKDTLKKGVIF